MSKLGIIVPNHRVDGYSIYESISKYSDKRILDKIVIYEVLNNMSSEDQESRINFIEDYYRDIDVVFTRDDNSIPHKSPIRYRIFGTNFIDDPDISHILYMDSDDFFHEAFFDYLLSDVNRWPNEDEIFTFDWIFVRKDGDRCLWEAVNEDTLLKVITMPCKVIPIELAKTISNFTRLPDPGIVSGEEADWCRYIKYKVNLGTIKIIPVNIPVSITYEPTGVSNETSKSYTNRDFFVNHIKYFSNRISHALSEDEIYVFTKCMADLCSSYVKYSNDDMYTRVITKIDPDSNSEYSFGCNISVH